MANINKIKLSGTTYNIQDSNAALVSDVFITSQNRNSIQSVIKEGVYSLSTDDVYSITGTKENSTDRIKGLIIVDNTSYNFTGSTSSDVEGVSALAGIVTFDLSSNFSISLVDRDTNHINELFIESFTSDGEESPMTNITITHNPSVGVNKIDYVATLYTEFVHEKYALVKDLETKQDTLVSGTNIKTVNNQSLLGSGNITIQGGGASVIEVTQAQYDALVTAGTLDLTALYIITDAQSLDISNYWTSAQTESAISAATSGLQETLVSGTNIKTINNESILGSGNITIQGGGSSYTAGSNIDITNDTISCTLPISAGSNSSGKGIIVGDNECSASGIYAIAFGHNADANGTYSICDGSNSSANSQMSFAFGDACKANGDMSWAIGRSVSTNNTKINQYAFGGYVSTNNNYQTTFGTRNVSSSSSGNFGHSGNTLFTIGNGYDFSSIHNPHNAFEIRQNGDIYIPNTDDTGTTGDYAYSMYPMVRLQDTVTATAANTTALGGLKLQQITQAAYDALVTKDASTLYIITNVVN